MTSYLYLLLQLRLLFPDAEVCRKPSDAIVAVPARAPHCIGPSALLALPHLFRTTLSNNDPLLHLASPLPAVLIQLPSFYTRPVWSNTRP